MIELLNTLTVVFLISGYIAVIYGTVFKKNPSSFVTWALWAILDTFAWYGTRENDENLTLTLTFVIGTVIVAIIFFFVSLYREDGFTFGKVEWFTLGLVAICFYISQTGTPVQTIWASGLALSFAGIPWLNHLRKVFVIDLQTKIAAVMFLLAMISSESATILAGENAVVATSALIFWIIGCIVIFKPYKRA